ncbi:hypothetical protein N656DRAFT_511438 [Canariomyces notabilis]|uniref:Uncharacterized protein n=1 Tax=Canariomyces notabilis TaxID=2074819 RepID=A0AAN6T793_9PEZI|nr:hypothetical protein N656DRAFT_511438 [Canariomyces arenarius]
MTLIEPEHWLLRSLRPQARLCSSAEAQDAVSFAVFGYFWALLAAAPDRDFPPITLTTHHLVMRRGHHSKSSPVPDSRRPGYVFVWEEQRKGTDHDKGNSC